MSTSRGSLPTGALSSPPTRRTLAIALYDLADAAEDAGDLEAALRAVGEALEVLAPDDALRYAVDIKARCMELSYAAQPENTELPYLLADPRTLPGSRARLPAVAHRAYVDLGPDPIPARSPRRTASACAC